MQDTQPIDALFTDMQNFVKNDSVLGTPVPVGDKTLVPIVSVTMGYGSGTNKKDPAAPNGGAGVGIGAKISTNAVVVVEKDSVSMLPVGSKGDINTQTDANGIMNNLVNKIPEMINNFKGGQPQGMGQNQPQNQHQGQNQQQGQQQGQQQNQQQNHQQNQQQNHQQNQPQSQAQSAVQGLAGQKKPPSK